VRGHAEFVDAEIARKEELRPLLFDVNFPELLPQLFFMLYYGVDLTLARVITHELQRLGTRLRRQEYDGLRVGRPLVAPNSFLHVRQPESLAPVRREQPDLLFLELIFLFVLGRGLGHVRTHREEGDPAAVGRPARKSLAFIA